MAASRPVARCPLPIIAYSTPALAGGLYRTLFFFRQPACLLRTTALSIYDFTSSDRDNDVPPDILATHYQYKVIIQFSDNRVQNVRTCFFVPLSNLGSHLILWSTGIP